MNQSTFTSGHQLFPKHLPLKRCYSGSLGSNGYPLKPYTQGWLNSWHRFLSHLEIMRPWTRCSPPFAVYPKEIPDPPRPLCCNGLDTAEIGTTNRPSWSVPTAGYPGVFLQNFQEPEPAQRSNQKVLENHLGSSGSQSGLNCVVDLVWIGQI